MATRFARGKAMSQRFIRCPHCGFPHDMNQAVCPATGRPIDLRRFHTSSIPAVQREPAPASRPSPPLPAPAPRHVSSLPPRHPHRDILGRTIGGKYRVRSVLGEGGMGAVYEAENLPLGRIVAVKVLHPGQARKKVAVKRFHQEARAAGAIGHPNICEVYDLGTLDDGSPYLVMERLVGETLADRIVSEGALPFDDVIDVLTQVLSGLVAAHEKQIVHRDIKPENIFLTKRVGCPPVAKLLDFGVSKMIGPVMNERDEDLDLTRTGMVMGTPFYMSPEQARGDRNLDARVDLYACGIILYEMLTGKRPFIAPNYNALLIQILQNTPRPARELRPALPHGFDEVLDKALARKRDDRFQSAAAFQRELQGLRDRHPNGHGGMEVGELARQLNVRRPLPPPKMRVEPIARPRAEPQVARPPVEPAAHRQFEPPPPEEGDPRVPEPTPSSVEIPVLFSDTPMSGEQYSDADADAAATAIEDHPREHFPSSSDTDTTERRSDLGYLAMGKRPRTGPVTRPIARGATTERGRAPVFDMKTSDTELDDNNATLIQPATQALGALRRRPKTQAGEDTIRMEAQPNIEPPEADPAPPARAPKAPRT